MQHLLDSEQQTAEETPAFKQHLRQALPYQTAIAWVFLVLSVLGVLLGIILFFDAYERFRRYSMEDGWEWSVRNTKEEMALSTGIALAALCVFLLAVHTLIARAKQSAYTGGKQDIEAFLGAQARYWGWVAGCLFAFALVGGGAIGTAYYIERFDRRETPSMPPFINTVESVQPEETEVIIEEPSEETVRRIKDPSD